MSVRRGLHRTPPRISGSRRLKAEPPSLALALEPASLLRRLGALCYDLLLLAAILFSFTLIVLALRFGEPVPPGSLWFPLCLFAIVLTFFCGFWVHGGQTLGMRAWRIRVVTDEGRELGWSRATVRFGAALVSLAPAGLGFWWSAFDGCKRGWHDHWTHTRIVRVPNRR